MKIDYLVEGDWVLWWHPRKESWVPFKITIEVLAVYKRDYNFDAQDLKPIELTPELLEKNGFIKRNGFTNNNISWNEWVSPGGRIIINNNQEIINSNNIWAIHIDNEDMESIGNAELSYFHELQHIYKFHKIEKEFKV